MDPLILIPIGLILFLVAFILGFIRGFVAGLRVERAELESTEAALNSLVPKPLRESPRSFSIIPSRREKFEMDEERSRQFGPGDNLKEWIKDKEKKG